MESNSGMMYIKAQDGKLINMDHMLMIDCVDFDKSVKALSIGNKLILLGQYATLERAKEVMVELSRKLEYPKVKFIEMPRE